MKRSLLYAGGIDDKKRVASLCGTIGSRTLYHLSLDRTFEVLLPDEDEYKQRQYFLSVLSQPLTDMESIVYRQDILKDFMGRRDFFLDLLELYTRFTGLRDGHDRERQAMKRMIHATTAGAAAGTIMNLLQANATTLQRSLVFVKNLSELFNNSVFLSRGLRELHEAADRVAKDPAYNELYELCTDVLNIRPTVSLDMKVELGPTGQVEACKLVEHKMLHIVDPEAQKGIKGLFKRVARQDEDASGCVKIYQTTDTIYDKVSTAPLAALAEGIDQIVDQIFDEFCTAGDEMGFYYAALKYIREVRHKNVPIEFPKISENAQLSCTGLRDLNLLFTYENAKDVIPNNIKADEKSGGIIVFGENGSGKTVYLRSVGTAQILAQAGLPIPAEIAELSLRSQIVTQFSEAEKEFEKGNDAGRFEQEVRELASVIDDLDDGALVLLNETFQTTSYDEGAEGLFYILRYFSARGMQWLLVSHLHQLEGFLDKNDVHLFETQPGYKVAEMKTL